MRNRREDTVMKIPALLHLSRLGYAYLSAKNISRDTETNILPGVLKTAMERINGVFPDENSFGRLMKDLRDRLDRPDLGEAFYQVLRDGWNGLRLIDFEHPEHNIWQQTTELLCAQGKSRFRPDITLFVNGLPLAMIEVKTRDQAQGIRTEYDRMRRRFRNRDFRRFLQCVQVWAFTNDRENDPDRLLPTEGAFYAASARDDFPIYDFREQHPGIFRKIPPPDPEEKLRILADNGMQKWPAGREYRRSLSGWKQAHRMMTSLFSKERFLFLLRYGVQYEREPDQNGQTEVRKRLLTAEQFFILWDLQARANRGYRNWNIPSAGAAGDTAMAVSMLSLLGNLMPGSEIWQVCRSRKELLRTEAALRAFGVNAGPRGEASAKRLMLTEMTEHPEEWLQEPGGKAPAGKRIFLLPASFAGYASENRFRNRLRAADPDMILITRKAGSIPEGGNYTYLLECADGTLYCGWTNDLERRIRMHNEGKGAKYTRARRPVRLVYYEEFASKEEAMRREWRLKQMSRARKEQLIREAGEREETDGLNPACSLKTENSQVRPEHGKKGAII